MTTYADMQARIADELNRDDLTSQIQLAIKSAIANLETRPFYWNEQRSYIDTAATQRIYELPDNFQGINSLTLTYNNYITLLEPRSWNYIEDITSTTQSQGPPRSYAIYDYQLFVYPIPDQVYRLTMGYFKRLEDVSATGSANAWMNPRHGEEIVRTLAKVDLLENVIKGNGAFDQARVLGRRATQILANLNGENVQRTTTGRKRPTM